MAGGAVAGQALPWEPMRGRVGPRHHPALSGKRSRGWIGFLAEGAATREDVERSPFFLSLHKRDLDMERGRPLLVFPEWIPKRSRLDAPARELWGSLQRGL